MANLVPLRHPAIGRLIGISQIPFTPNCDSIDSNLLTNNSRTLLHYNCSKEQLRVTSNGEFYTLNKGNLISQIFYSTIHFFVKWYYEGWNPDTSIRSRLIQAIDVTFINEIRMVSREVGSIIQIAKDFENSLHVRPILPEDPVNTLREIVEKISPAYCRLISTIIKLIKIQNKLELKPSELRLYDTPFNIELADQIEQEMLREAAPRRELLPLRQDNIDLLHHFLNFYNNSDILSALLSVENKIYENLNPNIF